MRTHTMLLLLFLVSALSSASQEPKRVTRTISSDDAVILREIGAVVVAKKEALIVDIILGNHGQAASDISKDDEIKMANGKRVRSISDLRSAYDAVKPGETMKLGIQRGEQLLIVSFDRKSDEALNKEGGPGGMVMKIDTHDGDVVLPALGLILGTIKNTVTVNGTLPTAEGNFKSFTPKKGDRIISLNGAPVSTAEEFDEAYTALDEGATVTIVVSSNGKEFTATFPKPKPMGRRIMMTR